jgi:hypothetical protein
MDNSTRAFSRRNKDAVSSILVMAVDHKISHACGQAHHHKATAHNHRCLIAKTVAVAARPDRSPNELNAVG